MLIKDTVKEAAVQWVVPVLLGAIPLATYFKLLRDWLKDLGWESVTWVLAIFVALLSWLVISNISKSKRIKKLEDDLSKNFEHSLISENGTGFQLDTRTNERICPSCKVDKKAISYLTRKSYNGLEYLLCQACKNQYDMPESAS